MTSTESSPVDVHAHGDPNAFPGAAREALGNDHLRGALRRATGLFSERRANALASVDDWEGLRERARAIKQVVLEDLDHYLGQFIEQAEANGCVVHVAEDGEAACRILGELCASSGARRLVKSKSMTTEEIGLNQHLATQGIEPVETDLGEWIIQLAGETPSHIIVPAIHKTKADVAQLFVDKLRIEPTEDEAELCEAARGVLRDHFAQADLGISGVNFAVAETGSMLVLENEGNARMTTSLPRVHVAVMGIEKVIPRLSDLGVFLRLLPRSGTGQHLTSYQSILTGPGGAVEGDVDGERGEGPREMHIVLLDNGRSSMLREEVRRQSLACIRCGACLNACPVYQQVGGHAYGSVYPGPIGAVITPQLQDLHQAKTLPFASSLCGACRDVCPVKIDIPRLLLHLRSDVKEGEGTDRANPAATPSSRPSFQERMAFRLWSKVFASHRRVGFALGLARWAQRLGLGPDRRAWVRRLAPPLRAWTAGRELRPLGERSFRSRWKRRGKDLR